VEVKGRLGKLKAQIPWYALGSKPVQIYGENLYITAKPYSADSNHSRKESVSVEDSKGTHKENSEPSGAEDVDEETSK
jgi:hypothetical protein